MDQATLQMRLAAASVVVATVGILGYITPEVPGYWALGGLLPAVLLTIVGVAAGHSGPWIIWRSVWMGVASVWLACAWANTLPAPWSPWTAGAWLAGAATVVMVSPTVAATRRPEGPGLMQRMLSGRALEWQ